MFRNRYSGTNIMIADYLNGLNELLLNYMDITYRLHFVYLQD